MSFSKVFTVRDTVLKLKTSSVAKILILSLVLAVLALALVMLTVLNTLTHSSEAQRANYHADILKELVKTNDIRSNLESFRTRFSHFDVDERPVAIFNEDLQIVFQSRNFRPEWTNTNELKEAFATKGLSNRYDYLKAFLPSRHYYRGELPLVAVFVDDKKGDLSKAIQLIFFFFFVSIIACTALLLIYFMHNAKTKVLALEDILSNIEGEKKLLTPDTLFDRFTRLTEVINGLLSTLHESIAQKETIAKSKFELFGQLTHDIRTPLTSIQTATETLFQGKKLDDGQLQTLRSIINMDVEYLTRLVDDLLFLSLLETPHDKETELETAGSMLKTLTTKYASADRTFQPRVADEELARISFPRYEFLRLFNNLLSNAFRYSKSLVRLEAHRSPGIVIVKIQNDYESLDMKALHSYGTKRSQRKIDSSHQQSSIGLGSVIVASIVEKWQGTYKLDVTEAFFSIEVELPVHKPSPKGTSEAPKQHA